MPSQRYVKANDPLAKAVTAIQKVILEQNKFIGWRRKKL